MWMPVPGTTTPEPAPVDDDSDAAFPSASMAEMCVVPPGDALSGCGAPPSLRAAAESELSDSRRRASPPR